MLDTIEKNIDERVEIRQSRGLVLVPCTGGQFAEDREIDIVVRCLLRLISYPTNK